MARTHQAAPTVIPAQAGIQSPGMSPSNGEWGRYKDERGNPYAAYL